MQIPEFIIPIRQFFVFAYLLVEPDQLTLIDTGLPNNLPRIELVLKQCNTSLSDIKRIFITHADGDHTGSLKLLQQKTGATTYTAQAEAEAIGVGKSSRELRASGVTRMLLNATRKMFDFQGAQVDEILEGGECFEILGGLRVLHSPGHTPGHLSFYLPQHHILFSGDSILTGKFPQPSKGVNTWDTKLANQSFEMQMALKPKLILGGHGMMQP